MFPEDTMYSKGYTERKFKQIKKGKSKIEVLEILGQPMDQIED